jgi:hypothetical protein
MLFLMQLQAVFAILPKSKRQPESGEEPKEFCENGLSDEQETEVTKMTPPDQPKNISN